MEHIIPQSHKELLQRILEELIKQRDSDPQFIEHHDPPEPEPEPPVIGH